MKNRLLICFLLLFSFKAYSQCVVLSQPSVAICAGSVATLSANGGNSYTWYTDAAATNAVGTGQNFVTPVLNSTATYYVVVVANNCTSAPLPVMVTVSPQPQPPTVSNVSICSGSQANLHADGSSTVFNWYTVPAGGTSIISSPDFTTPPLTATTTYYAETTSNGCQSSRVPVTVTVNPIPAAPVSQTVAICYGSPAALTAGTDPSAVYQWYDDIAGGNPFYTGSTYTTPALTNSTTYYVQNVNGECASNRVPVNVTVMPQLAPPSVPGAIVCSGSVTTLTATSPGGTYQWFDAPTGGNLINQTATYTTPALTATTTYYVQNTIDGCTSPMAAVTVTVLPPVPAPTAANTSVCSGDQATLTASGQGSSYAWYDSATGGNLLSSTQAYLTPALTATTTYYAETSANGCTSARTPVTVTVNPIPAPAVVSGTTTVCQGTGASLTATANGAVAWYDAASGGNLLSTANTFNTPALQANTTYYVQNTTGQCVSTRTAVTVSVTPVINPQFQYTSGTYCTSDPDPTPVINNPAGGTFTASPSGLSFINPTTGQINIAASTPGTYTVSFTSTGTCAGTTSTTITITPIPNAQFSYNGPFCQDGVDPSPVFANGAGGGTFSATPAGLVFVNTSSGEIDLAASTPGKYTITNTITPTGSNPCPPSSATNTVTIAEKVAVSAGPDRTVQAGSTVPLAGSVSGGASGGTWSGGIGSFSNPSQLNATYTPGPGETTAVLTLTSNNPRAPCGPKSATVTITIIPVVPAPTAPGINVCSGSNAILTATAPGGNYSWYATATDNNPIATGPNFSITALTATTTYYVQTEINGFASSRTAVTAKVNAIPAAPTAPGVQICAGGTAKLTASSPADAYQWYDAAVGGNLLSTENTYVTPVLTANTTFYVLAVVNGCTSDRTPVNVSVTPTFYITSAATANICSGSTLNYTITASMPGAVFSWSRAQVAGISNPELDNQTSANINETLVNTGNTPVNVTYVITALNGACSGPAFNYVVTVYPTPVVTSAATVTICNYSPVDYAIIFNTASTFFSWSRAAVPGISNASISGQTSATIKEVLFNTTNSPVNVTYIIDSQTSTCTGIEFKLTVTVNPTTVVTSAASSNVCTGEPQNYVIAASIPSTTYLWSRSPVNNISNPAVYNQSSSTINEALINTGTTPVLVVYNITPYAYGCTGTTFQYSAIVNPKMKAPVTGSNSPVCVDGTIKLSTDSIPGASYLWTGPNGFTSPLRNPQITNAAAADGGTYSLAITLNGCTSPAGNVDVTIDEPPVANAGPDQTVCISVPSVLLAGTITGGPAAGVWTTAGSGTFSPSNNTLNALYIPSDADRAAGSVLLTLSSVSTDNCAVSTSAMTIKFGPSPGADAGPDQTVCAQTGSVSLDGKIIISGGGTWSTSGTGTFSPSATQLNASYIPGAEDVKNGSVTLTLTADGANDCYIVTSEMTIHFSPPPFVYAGGTKYILRGNTVALTPVVNEPNLTYLWSPDVNISDVHVKDPVITGNADQIYTLTVTDVLGCTSSSQVAVKIAPPLVIDNTFTPNGDGINDVWNITGLIAYNQATVDIFTRYGTKIYHSIGYNKPFDGTFNGKALPVGVYYYVIDTKFNGQILSGYVTIIR